MKLVLFHQPVKQALKADVAKREADLAKLKAQHNIADET